jgi:GT2 family glycosyltransferase
MDLSIIIVSYGTRDVTLACLASAFACKLDAEVIVVDNASEDGSADAISQCHPGVRLVRNPQNVGFAAANNQGMAMARGRYWLLLNSDTLVLGDVLARSVEYMDANPAVGVMGCRVLNPDRSLQRTCFRYPSMLNLVLMLVGLDRLPWPAFFGRHQMTDWKRDTERNVDVVTGCYMMVRPSAAQQIGLLDEAFFFCGEETDWCWRFRHGGWQVRFAPVGEIIHIGNASGKLYKFRRDLMLSEGLVRLHRKRSGVVGAVLAWSLLFLFNVTRAWWWGGCFLLGGGKPTRDRCRHFSSVVMSFKQAWPAQKVDPCAT